MYKAYLYVEDQGDGSSSIVTFDEEITEDFLDTVGSYYLDSFRDGDGITLKKVLTFPSKQEALDCGLAPQSLEDYFSG